MCYNPVSGKDNPMRDAAYSPRVVGEIRPDYHSLETLLAAPRFRGRQGEALALALYDTFTSTVDGTWHGWPANEREGEAGRLGLHDRDRSAPQHDLLLRRKGMG
jgi:hypothetical protein